MSNIRLTAFSGEQPRLIARLMPENGAQSARDVRLDDGGLTPIRISSVEGELPDTVETPQTLYRWQERWLGWNGVVHAAPGPVAQNRLYYTGDGAPKVLVEPTTPEIPGVEEPTTFPLAVPRPPYRWSASVSGAVTPPPPDPPPQAFSRLYTYTWVTALGEESEPAPPSNQVQWRYNQKVTLTATGGATVPTGRLITKQRIYRSQTGTQGTFYYFIAERDVVEGALVQPFDDELPIDAFAEPLPSTDYNIPPSNLSGLVAMPGGMMAAFVGKKLYFCEPYQPHAWPEKYILTFDYTIVALGAMGNALLVMTDGNPYMVTGSHPAAMQSQRIEQNLACVGRRSVVDLGYAIAYASNEGLVVARADGSMGVASYNLFNRDDWITYGPTSLIGCQVAGRYVGFYSALQVDTSTYKTGGLVIDLANPVFLIHTDIYARAAFYDLRTSSLYYVPTNSSEVLRLDSPWGARKKLYWKSKEFILPAPDNFGALLIESVEHRSDAEYAAFINARNQVIAKNEVFLKKSVQGEIDAVPMNYHEINGDIILPVPQDDMVLNVGVYADKKLVMTTNDVNQAVRLPGGFKARTWEIDVSTNMEVFRIAMAKSMDELKVTA